jgi:hypothetical protein
MKKKPETKCEETTKSTVYNQGKMQILHVTSGMFREVEVRMFMSLIPRLLPFWVRLAKDGTATKYSVR